MLMRYTMYRGKRPEADPLPDGIRQDTRKHTRHILRPPEELVVGVLNDTIPWSDFQKGYLDELDKRFTENSEPFENLANLSREENVFLGCSCPTKKNPEVSHCHTVLALQFMAEKFPGVPVRFPDDIESK